MRRFVSSISAAAIALTSVATFAAPSVAAPVAPSIQSTVGNSAVEEVRHRRGSYKRGKYYYYNGHRGHRSYHRGYRRHNGYWFPPAAFALGAIIGGAIAAQPQYRVVQPSGNWSTHVRWCYDRYRSYRQSDNTFQPYHGPRKACVSPYYR